MGKHKNVVCEICCRVMRRDHLERHMKQHENGKFEEESFHGSANTNTNTNLVQVQHLCRAVSVPYLLADLLPSMRRW